MLNKKQIEEILDSYAIGKIVDFKFIKNGFMHSHYFLQTDTGFFVLRIYEARTDDEALLEAKVLKRLDNTNIPIPNMIPTDTGKYFTEYKQKRVALFYFLPGKDIEEKQVTLTHIKNLGCVLGKLHKELTGFKPKEINSKNDYTVVYIKKILEKIKKEHTDFPVYHEKIILENLKKIDIPTLPKGINHGDMFGDNVLFVGSDVTGVLDFDDCYYGNFLGDLSRGLIYWCIGDFIDFQKCKCFVQAYIEQRSLNEEEIDYLYEQTLLIALVHAVHLLEDEENWTEELRPIKVINNLNKITKEEFYSRIFSK